MIQAKDRLDLPVEGSAGHRAKGLRLQWLVQGGRKGGRRTGGTVNADAHVAGREALSTRCCRPSDPAGRGK